MVKGGFPFTALLMALAGLSACGTDHCADHVIGQATCEGNHVVGCMKRGLSYSSFDSDCGAQICLDPEPGVAFCALQSEPDPRCPPTALSESLQLTCSAGHLLYCMGSYATYDLDCGGADLCYTPPPGPAGSPAEPLTCVFSAAIDPRCAAAPVPAGSTDPRQKSVCLENEIILCVDDRVWGTTSCGPQGCTAQDGCS